LQILRLNELTPEEKPRCIRAMHERVGAVAMVGDSINEAPALAVADIGIALGCSADGSGHLADVPDGQWESPSVLVPEADATKAATIVRACEAARARRSTSDNAD
jgi:magnesium-transporting ATPase (P-type)